MPDSQDSPLLSAPLRVAVIGGGITGLSAAHRLLELRSDLEVTLFESSGRVGGVLETVERDGFLVERSADNFLTKTPFATSLCDRLGLSEELLPTDPARRRALLVHDGKVKPTPEGFVIAAPRKVLPLLRSDVLSLAAKLRLACEPLTPARRDDADESVASFVRRRLGQEVLDRLVQPLVGGIYTADLERLSMAATLPQFREQEQQHGSLWRAARHANNASPATESGARYGAFVAPRGGMSQIVAALEQRLPTGSLRSHIAVGSLIRSGNEWQLNDQAGHALGTYSGVVIATPAAAAGQIVRELDAELSAGLASIEYAGSVVVCLACHQDQLPGLPNGFGLVVPAREGRRILAASFSSLKFPGRAPDGELLIRVFIGGALQPELTRLDDEQLEQLATEELQDLMKLRGAPRLLEVVRWPQAMPQYHVGHLDRMARLRQQTDRHLGLELAGAAYHGVGVPQCVHSGEQAAERVLTQLGGPQLGGPAPLSAEPSA